MNKDESQNTISVASPLRIFGWIAVCGGMFCAVITGWLLIDGNRCLGAFMSGISGVVSGLVLLALAEALDLLRTLVNKQS